MEFELEAILSSQVVFQLLFCQGVTGGLHCIILNYEARLCYYKLTGRSVKYGNVLLRTASNWQFHKLPVCIRLSLYDYRHNVSPHFHHRCLSQLSLPTFELPFYKNMCPFYITR